MDTGEYVLPAMFFLSLRKCMEEQGHAGSIEMGVVTQEGSGCGIFPFTYTHVFTVSLIFS